ncbi:hypothetical protein [Auraticoccus monumenti]|uniref:hypothetical protein n=1 Tax=Auraticoccus monumenti TaxID=675864 RepID=UPI0012FB67E0|nr:hypothetical protein [Auraticoccus monumenti]
MAAFDERGAAALAEARDTGDVLVALAYHRCQGVQLYADPWDDQLWFQVPPERERTVCAWSPYSVEVWAVPEDDLPAPWPEVELATATER